MSLTYRTIIYRFAIPRLRKVICIKGKDSRKEDKNIHEPLKININRLPCITGGCHRT